MHCEHFGHTITFCTVQILEGDIFCEKITPRNTNSQELHFFTIEKKTGFGYSSELWSFLSCICLISWDTPFINILMI